jgi:hypothetical protein
MHRAIPHDRKREVSMAMRDSLSAALEREGRAAAKNWRYTATRCAMEGCERTRRKGWTTCALFGHAERGVSLYGLKSGEPRLTPDHRDVRASFSSGGTGT